MFLRGKTETCQNGFFMLFFMPLQELSALVPASFGMATVVHSLISIASLFSLSLLLLPLRLRCLHLPPRPRQLRLLPSQ